MSDSNFDPEKVSGAEGTEDISSSTADFDSPMTNDKLDAEPAADVAEQTAENVDEAKKADVEEAFDEAPVKKAATHMTASAASINAENEEADIRRKDGNANKKAMKKSRISYERKKRLYGYGFIALWFIGTIYMFIIPLVQSIVYSFCFTDLVDAETGAQKYGMTNAGIYAEWNDFGNYQKAFFQDPDYLPALTESLSNLAPKAVLVLIFSLFIAVLLNQKFKARTFARAVFFLPVLIATGPVISVINGDMLSSGVSDASQFSALFKTDFVDDFMRFIGIYNMGEQFTEMISQITSDIFNLIWSSGIQIIIFLAALQQIPVSAREAASMEGATAWEFFWKITFPTISPMILANLIYTVIDTFVDADNPVMEIVLKQSSNWEFGYSAALAWIYFAIIGIALGIIVAIVSRFVFYQVD